MYKFFTKNGQTFGFGLGLALVVIMLLSIFSGVEEFSSYAEDDMQRYQTSIFNAGMYAAIGLVILAALAAVAFGLFQLAGDPKGAIKGVGGLLAVVVIFFIIYSSADPDLDMLKRLEDFVVTPGQSKMITGAIWTALLLAGAAVVSTAVAEVANFFR